MAIDRDETLRKAEKLLRQGNLPGAIAEYVRVVDEFPADVNTVNKLAELYQRAGDTDRAVAHFTRVADHWLREGAYGKAAAHYKKILKLRPNDEAALLQLVQASIRQGSLVEAKGYLKIARDAREARGDRPGADQLTLQLADLDPSDFDAKLKGIRVRLAQEPSRSMVGEVRAAIAELEKAGRGGEAEDLLAGLIKLDPDNVDARVQVVEAAMRRGDDAAARAALPANPEESHRPEVVALAAELELKAGRVDEARPLLQRLLSLDRSRGRVTIRELGERLRAVDLSVAYACVEAVVDDQTSAREFVDASEALKRFLKLSKHHVPALLRLVEVAVDGDLDKDVTLAQRQLADAYLAEGEALKARVIAEDLLSRDPRSLSERKRLHRALVALGEDDPDGIITELLSDQLGLGDDLTPVDDTEDDEAAEAEAGEAAAAAVVSGSAEEPASAADAESVEHGSSDAAARAEAGAADAEPVAAAVTVAGADVEAIEPFGAVEPPPADALFPATADALFPAPIETAGEPEMPELPDLGAVAAPDSDRGIAFEPEPLDFLPTDPDLSIGDPDLPLAAGLGADHAPGPDLLPDIEPPASGHVSPDVPLPAIGDTEFDLTGALNALSKNGVSISEALDAVMPPPAKTAAHTNGAGEETDLERVFDGLRNQAAGDMVEMAQPDQSMRLLSMADTYQAAGMFDEARAAFEQVATDSRHRFRAASSLGRLFWQQGDADASLRWMELASEAPAPNPEAGRALMYELGEKLEQTGETTRALAVFLELLGEQEDYRDVRQRVDRLSRVQAEG